MEKQDKKSVLEDFYSIKEKPKNTHQGLVLFFHHVMICQGFRLVGLSEKEEPREFKDELPVEWNKNEESYTFKYKHSQSSLTYLIKFVPLSLNMIISAVCLEDPKPVLMELACTDYIKGDSLDDLKEYFKDLEKLAKIFLDKIVSGIYLEKTEKNKETQDQTQQGQHERQEFNGQNFETRDTYDPLRIGPIRSPNQILPNRPFGNFGDSDLYPSFPNFGGGNRGNQMGPNDPMFQGRFRPGQMRPPPNVPQGARFDPFGPTPNTNTQEPEPDHFQMPNQRPRNNNQRRDDDFDYFL